jgi:hypothetical protein
LLRYETIPNWGLVAIVLWDRYKQRAAYSACTRSIGMLDALDGPPAPEEDADV